LETPTTARITRVLFSSQYICQPRSVPSMCWVTRMSAVISTAARLRMAGTGSSGRSPMYSADTKVTVRNPIRTRWGRVTYSTGSNTMKAARTATSRPLKAPMDGRSRRTRLK
jgi:hypothetical protein